MFHPISTGEETKRLPCLTLHMYFSLSANAQINWCFLTTPFAISTQLERVFEIKRGDALLPLADCHGKRRKEEPQKGSTACLFFCLRCMLAFEEMECPERALRFR